MKKILAITAIASMALTSFGQGIIQFNNRDSSANPPVIAPIYLNTVGGTPLAGTGYRAALYGGASTSTAFSLVGGSLTGGTGLSLLVSPTTGAGAVDFRTGAAAGYVNVGVDAARTVPTVNWGGTGLFQVVAWEGTYATLAEALAANAAFGFSNPLTLTLPTGPTDQVLTKLVGLNSFAVAAVPEPTSFALAGLGAAALLIFRRRN